MTEKEWNDTHTINSQHQYCYCQRDRNLLDVSLQCRRCLDWFHPECTSVANPPALLFSINYSFTCRNCNPTKTDAFERTTAGWKDICVTAVANMVLEDVEYKLGEVNKSTFDSKNSHLTADWGLNQYYFNKKQIIPYVDEHWKDICTERQRTTTWWATLGSCLYSAKEIFTARNEQFRSAASDFTFNDPDLWHIRPLYVTTKSSYVPKEKRKLDDTARVDVPSPYPKRKPSISSSTTATETTTTKAPSPQRNTTTTPPPPPPTTTTTATTNTAPPATNYYQHAEKWVVANTPSPKSSSSPSVTTPTITSAMFSSSNNTDHPFNRFGFKYTPCEKSTTLPHLAYQQTDTSTINGLGCAISITDKSSYVSVARDGLTVTTDKGFRMCRANMSVKEGDWYWEATILKGNDDTGGHVRIGWARREACLNAPVGYDAYSYGFRDKTGEKVFCSRPQAYGESFQTGDVIGLYISLPKPNHDDTFKSATRKRIPIAFKDTLWFEEKDYRQCKEMENLADRYRKDDDPGYQPKTIQNSSITMYKNGICLGVMYQDLTDFQDFGSLPEMILTQQQQKKKRKTNSKKDDATTETTTSSSLTTTPRMRMIDDDEFDGNAKHQQWNDDPPLADDGSLGYYPAVSVYKGGMVSCNFGPDFKFPPPSSTPWKPMSQRQSDYMAEECVWDLVDEVSRSFRKKMVE